MHTIQSLTAQQCRNRKVFPWCRKIVPKDFPMPLTVQSQNYPQRVHPRVHLPSTIGTRSWHDRTWKLHGAVSGRSDPMPRGWRQSLATSLPVHFYPHGKLGEVESRMSSLAYQVHLHTRLILYIYIFINTTMMVTEILDIE
jgi:hypothetical protein